MNARQLLKEVLRQREVFKREADNAPHPLIKEHCDSALATIDKTLETAKQLAETDPDSEVPMESARAIVQTARVLEMLHTLMAKIPVISDPFVLTPGDRSILIYIELPHLNLDSWGPVLGQLIQAPIQLSLKNRFLLGDSPVPISCIGFEDFFFCSIVVTDQAQALPLVQAELEGMALLPFCQIGHRDDASGVFRTFYANRTLRPFEECLMRVAVNYLKILNIPAGLPPGRR